MNPPTASAARHLVPAELLDPVIAYFAPRKIILFGSHARGEAGPDSDIDLLVVLDDEAPAEKLTAKAAWESRRSFAAAADVIPISAARFERKRRIVGTLAEAANSEGVVVYERP